MKLYKREGRRFVEIQNAVGMYYQKDGTFQKERNENSIGVCVIQTYDVRTVALFKMSYGTWGSCKQFCEDCGGYMPTRSQLLQLKSFVKCGDIKQSYYWTQDEYSSDYAWYLGLGLGTYFGYCIYDNKNSYGRVLAFVDIPI